MSEQDKRNLEQQRKANSKPPSFNWKRFLILGLLLFVVFYFFGQQGSGTREISWQQLEEYIEEGKVQSIEVINQQNARIYLPDSLSNTGDDNGWFSNNAARGPVYTYTLGSVETFENKINEAEAGLEEEINVRYTYQTNWLAGILPWLIPLGLILGFWYLMRKRAQKAMGGANPFSSMGKSKAKVYDQENGPKVKFKDIAGLEEAKTEVEELVHYLRDTSKYVKVGAKIPKGVMLVGPPGTGKTMMAKAVAGEANVPFFSISGSDFVEMFVGVGASRVRNLFKEAQEKSPCIIFIDEIDAIGRSRGRAKSMQSNDEQENTLNQMLQELDGFSSNSGVIVLAATNRKDILDKALLRPGRFDRQIYLDLPNRNEREAIFKVHLQNINVKEQIDLSVLAAQSAGFSGADIANICNEAALIAARNERESVTQRDFYDAMDRVVAGLEKKSRQISDQEKEIISYHEAGHAVASHMLPNVDSLVKVSIIPRGRSLGANWYLPKERNIMTRSQIFDKMCATLAGRAAEELVFDEISSGALDDLEKVTKMAYTMVSMYGLSQSVGNLSFHDSTGQYQQSFQKPYSEYLGKKIDEEVQSIVEDAYQKAKDLLSEEKGALENIAELLKEQEVIEKKDVEKAFEKQAA
jgi:cell division protease FtsH